MSIATKAFKTAVVAPMVLAAFLGAANANAGSAHVVELADLNLHKPIPSGTCFETNSKGTASEKLDIALAARDQKRVFDANRVTLYGKETNILTSNLKLMNPKIPHLYGEGYHIVADGLKNQEASGYCIDRLKATYVVNSDEVKVGQGAFGRGEMGGALRNGSRNAQNNFAFGALTDLGTLIAASFNSHSLEGTLILADGGGNSSVRAPLVDADYSKHLSNQSRAVIGIPPVEAVASVHVSAGPSLALAGK